MSASKYSLQLDSGLDPVPLCAGLIWAEEICPPRPTTDVPPFLGKLLGEIQRTDGNHISDSMKKRVRDILRHGRYKPCGRGKPASEFLLRSAMNGTFPLVNPPVDVNNYISLASGLPGSIFDASVSGTHLLIRRGIPEESYVFNQAGQVINLEDLLVVCRRKAERWEPCGNPVKDRMETKVNAATRNLVAVLYAPPDEPTQVVEDWSSRYAELLREHCLAKEVGCKVFPGSHPQGRGPLDTTSWASSRER